MEIGAPFEAQGKQRARRLPARIYTLSGGAAAISKSSCRAPSCGWVALSVTVPGCSFARIQMAPVPPTRAKGLSPMISAGPSSSNLMASLANGRIAPNSSVTRRTTRVRVGAVGDQFGVIGEQHEFLVDAAAGHGFRNDLLAGNVAFDAQIAPLGIPLSRDRRRTAGSAGGRIRFCWGRLRRPACRRYKTSGGRNWSRPRLS